MAKGKFYFAPSVSKTQGIELLRDSCGVWFTDRNIYPDNPLAMLSNRRLGEWKYWFWPDKCEEWANLIHAADSPDHPLRQLLLNALGVPELDSE